jgi:hypothetical protein
MTSAHPILLRPHLGKRVHCRRLLEPVHPCLLHTGAQVVPLIPAGLAQRLALRLVFGEVIVFYPFPIPLIPVRRDLLLEPVWRHGRQHVERRAQRLPDEFEWT